MRAPVEIANLVEPLLFRAEAADLAGDGSFARTIQADEHHPGASPRAFSFAGGPAVMFEHAGNKLDDALVRNWRRVHRFELRHEPALLVGQIGFEARVLDTHERARRIYKAGAGANDLWQRAILSDTVKTNEDRKSVV